MEIPDEFDVDETNESEWNEDDPINMHFFEVDPPKKHRMDNTSLNDWTPKQVEGFVNSVLVKKAHIKTAESLLNKFASIHNVLAQNEIFSNVHVPGAQALMHRWTSFSKSIQRKCAVSTDATNLSAREGSGPTPLEKKVLEMCKEAEQQKEAALLAKKKESERVLKQNTIEAETNRRSLTTPKASGLSSPIGSSGGEACEAEPKRRRLSGSSDDVDILGLFSTWADKKCPLEERKLIAQEEEISLKKEELARKFVLEERQFKFQEDEFAMRKANEERKAMEIAKAEKWKVLEALERRLATCDDHEQKAKFQKAIDDVLFALNC